MASASARSVDSDAAAGEVAVGRSGVGNAEADDGDAAPRLPLGFGRIVV
jgi:hypothetical protein